MEARRRRSRTLSQSAASSGCLSRFSSKIFRGSSHHNKTHKVLGTTFSFSGPASSAPRHWKPHLSGMTSHAAFRRSCKLCLSLLYDDMKVLSHPGSAADATLGHLFTQRGVNFAPPPLFVRVNGGYNLVYHLVNHLVHLPQNRCSVSFTFD